MLFVGDGNAGRAWKRRIARVFDDNERDAKRHIYIQSPSSLRHKFLVSVPLLDAESSALIYGILNIGTYSDSQAEQLRCLASSDQVEQLTGYAQAYVLKRLLEAARM